MKLSNMDQEEAWSGGAMLPVGVHDVKIEEITEGVSSGGHPQLEIQYTAPDGSGIKEWMVVIPVTYGKVRALLDACKVEVQGGDWDFNPATLRGAKLSIRVGEEDYRGEPRKKVQGYYFFGQAESTVPADTEGLPSNGGSQRDDESIPF